MPSLVTHKVSQDKWLDLCNLVTEEKVLKIAFSDGSSEYPGRIAKPDIQAFKHDRVELEFRWQENDDARTVLRESVSWIKAKLT